MGVCRCCQVNNAVLTPPGPNGLPVEPTVCDLCIGHQGYNVHDLKRAAAIHQQMWQEHERQRITALADEYEAKLRGADAESERLRQQLQRRPTQPVEHEVDADAPEEAHRAAMRAYASREHAFRLLCLIHVEHHDLPGEECSCGRPTADCDALRILEGDAALRRWERIQEEREQRGLPHGLPSGYVRRGWRAHMPDPHDFVPEQVEL